MTTREEFLSMALSLGNAYTDTPFHDDNWVLVRHRGNRKTFAFTFEREGAVWVNVKLPLDWKPAGQCRNDDTCPAFPL